MAPPVDLSRNEDVFVVRGGACLRGEIAVNGAKNSALKLMAASLLAAGTTRVTNVPCIADVPVMADVLTGTGCEVAIDHDTEGSATCEVTVTADDPGWSPPRESVTRIRASIAVLGPLVGRLGRARLAPPGGDRIGARRIDMHLSGLAAMGAEVAEDGDTVEVNVPDGRLHGAELTLDFPSVGATENLVMAATLADGRTVIDNAAREPEIQDLCAMLTSMGAEIDGVGTQTLEVTGVSELDPVDHETVPDRIEAGTFALAAALTDGDLIIEGARADHLVLPLAKLRAAGADVDTYEGGIRVAADGLRAVDVVTLPYPGFPTDLQPQLMVALSQARGTSIVTENVYESRFAFIDELNAMGAEIVVDGHHAVIRGPRRFQGADVRALDVRAGAACLLAGLVADGDTTVSDIDHIDRGYACIADRLAGVGADIERLGVPALDRS